MKDKISRHETKGGGGEFKIKLGKTSIEFVLMRSLVEIIDYNEHLQRGKLFLEQQYFISIFL